MRGENVTAGYEFRAHMKEDPNLKAFYSVGGGEAGAPAERWLRTGDKGWVDADGHLALSGRLGLGLANPNPTLTLTLTKHSWSSGVTA